MTAYSTRATIVCPEAMMADANQLALVTGENAADDQTFRVATWQDAAGNLYAVSSTAATGSFTGKATTALTAPTHAPDVDLEAAGRAQAALYIYGVHGTEGAAPGHLWALLEPAPGSARAALDAAKVTQADFQDGEGTRR